MKSNQCKGVSATYPTLKVATQLPQLPVLMIFALTFFFYSCKKELQVTDYGTLIPMQLKESEELIFVEDGVLCFIDFQTMDVYLKTLLEMPDSLRKIQEAVLGFTSYATLFDSINDYIASASTENEMLQRINANSTFVCIKDSTLVSQLPSFGRHYLANGDGIFKSDSTYYRIFEQGIVAWRGATLSQMKNLTLDEDFDEDSSDGKYFYIKELTIEPTESGCGNYHRIEKYTNSGWYRVIFELKVLMATYYPSVCPANQTSIQHTYYYLEAKVRGQVKRFWMWHAYNSVLEFKEVSCQLMVPRQGYYNYADCSYVPYFELGGATNKQDMFYGKELTRWYDGNSNGMGDMTHNYPHLPNPAFIKVKGMGKSAAFDANNWAAINCGY